MVHLSILSSVTLICLQVVSPPHLHIVARDVVYELAVASQLRILWIGSRTGILFFSWKVSFWEGSYVDKVADDLLPMSHPRETEGADPAHRRTYANVPKVKRKEMRSVSCKLSFWRICSWVYLGVLSFLCFVRCTGNWNFVFANMRRFKYKLFGMWTCTYVSFSCSVTRSF